MKVSVIIPFHNPNMKYLDEAIESALNQTYKPYEIILINDCSDKFKWKNKWNNLPIEYLELDKNSGPSKARNVGVFFSKGELVSFLDADDIWAPRKLELSVKEFENDPDIGMTCGNYRWLLNGKLCNPFYRKTPRVDFKTLQKVNLVASGSVTVLRDVFDAVNGFDEKYWVGEDYHLWLKIARAYPIKFINEVLYFYRRENEGETLSVRKDLADKTFNVKSFR